MFSAYVKEVDKKPAATSWGPKMTFGNNMAEISSGGGMISSHYFLNFYFVIL